ncbi:F-box only protein 22-like isoform X3 [Physella acuta]|uniref:F-box only protein 22-like isoform X2 n=1 Tax=Physella acuta TaxID=109671 RepID=UPI0027DB4DC6|nr:F-box only protein 22-like isoform X2 [Physella acuta]XP_059175768.1 F-box only protein 22-like isoform X3 [Physella acuta]
MDISGNVLTNVIIVLDRIFKFLSARQLNTCSRVCKTWCDQARREKASRAKMRWNYFKHTQNIEDGHIDEQWWTLVKHYILDSPLEPRHVLMFCTDTLWSSIKEHNSQTNIMMEFLSSSLPALCVFHVVVTDGIVGTDEAMKTEELEEYTMALSLVMFGQLLGAEFVPFSSSHAECLQLASYWSGQSQQIPPCVQSLKKKKVQMINLYCPMSGIDQEISYSLYRMFDWPLIAGGYVNEKVLKDFSHKVFNSDESSDSCIVSGLALCGDQVQVASVLIRSDVDREEEVDQLVSKLKAHNFPLHHSIGLMYACVGRGFHVYNKHNVESGIFRKHFPQTPLLGFFGNGEIGCFYSTSSRNIQEYERRHPPKLLHAYTTVMCLISLP